MTKHCEHQWGDVSVGLWTGQQNRICEKCGAIQHTLDYAGHDWIDGAPLSVEEFQRRSQFIADHYKAMG